MNCEEKVYCDTCGYHAVVRLWDPSPCRSIHHRRAGHGGHHPAIGGRGGQGKTGADRGRIEEKGRGDRQAERAAGGPYRPVRGPPPEENSSAPAEHTSSQAPASSQPATPASSSQPEIPPQPEQEPAPATTKQPAKTKPVNEGTIFEGYEVKVSDWTTPAVFSGGRDWPISTWYVWGPGETVLGSISGSVMDKISRKYAASTNYDPDIDWSTWHADAFNEYRNIAGGGNTSSGSTASKEPGEDESSQQAGAFLEDDALAVVRLVNEEREKQGLEPLDVDENLMELARIRAEELEEKFSHERPDGTHAAQVFSGGENIAGDYTSPSAVMEAWMGSEGHRNNILRERFHYIGVSCYQDANGDLHWVQLFSPRKT